MFFLSKSNKQIPNNTKNISFKKKKFLVLFIGKMGIQNVMNFAC